MTTSQNDYGALDMLFHIGTLFTVSAHSIFKKCI